MLIIAAFVGGFEVNFGVGSLCLTPCNIVVSTVSDRVVNTASLVICLVDFIDNKMHTLNDWSVAHGSVSDSF